MNIQLEDLQATCINTRSSLTIEPDGGLWFGGVKVSRRELEQRTTTALNIITVNKGTVLEAEGYESLARVLGAAFHQAARGKGHERHANGEPFSEQVMQDGAHRFGVGSLLFQAFKKSEESQRLPHDRAVAELLGAINYLAGAVIALERRQHDADPVVRAVMSAGYKPANENAKCCGGGIQTAARCDGCPEQSGLRAEQAAKK